VQSGGVILYLLFLLGVLWFFMIRPQQRRAREHRQLMESLKVGEKVITVGGVYGRIKSIDDNTLKLTIASNVDITVAKAAVAQRAESQELAQTASS